MRWLLGALPVLACGAMMLLVCVPMLLDRKHGGRKQADTGETVAALHEEISRLRAERAAAVGSDTHV
jgi:hypothetical protein